MAQWQNNFRQETRLEFKSADTTFRRVALSLNGEKQWIEWLNWLFDFRLFRNTDAKVLLPTGVNLSKNQRGACNLPVVVLNPRDFLAYLSSDRESERKRV